MFEYHRLLAKMVLHSSSFIFIIYYLQRSEPEVLLQSRNCNHTNKRQEHKNGNLSAVEFRVRPLRFWQLETILSGSRRRIDKIFLQRQQQNCCTYTEFIGLVLIVRE